MLLLVVEAGMVVGGVVGAGRRLHSIPGYLVYYTAYRSIIKNRRSGDVLKMVKVALFIVALLAALYLPYSTKAYCALANPSWFGRPTAQWNETTREAEVIWGSMIRRKRCVDGFRVKFENIKTRVTLHQADMACVIEGVKALLAIAEEAAQDTEVFHQTLREAEKATEVAKAKITPYQFIESPEIHVSLYTYM